MEKLCTNCYGGGHFRIDCTNQRVSWIEYVEIFMDAYPRIDRLLFGRWNNTLAAWKKTTQTKN